MYKEEIEKNIANALKSGNQIELKVWRAIKTEFVKYRTSGSNVDLTDEKELQIITKMVQQRRDSIEQYRKAGRDDLVAIEDSEMSILLSLLPKEPSEEDIFKTIKDFLDKKSDKPTMKDMKDVMAIVKSKYPTVNGGKVSEIFRNQFI